MKGYVPGYDGVLGHEFVGTVEKCDSKPELIGKRVVGEINCPLDRDYKWVSFLHIAFDLRFLWRLLKLQLPEAI